MRYYTKQPILKTTNQIILDDSGLVFRYWKDVKELRVHSLHSSSINNSVWYRGDAAEWLWERLVNLSCTID